MDRTLFRNRMGMTNILYILAGFALATVIVVGQEGGRNLGMIATILGILIGITFLTLWLVMSLAMRRQVAELTRRGDVLVLEMIHLFGKGRMVEMPLAAVGNWNLGIAGTAGKRSGMITFDAAGETYRMPVQGASVLDGEGLRDIAPEVSAGLAEAGFLAARK